MVFKRSEILLVIISVVAISIAIFYQVYDWSPQILNTIRSEFPQLKDKNITYVIRFLEEIVREFNETDPDIAISYQDLIVGLNMSIASGVFESLGDQVIPFSITFTHILPLIFAVVFIVRFDRLVNSGIYGLIASARGGRLFPWIRAMGEWFLLMTVSLALFSSILAVAYYSNDIIRLAATPNRVAIVLGTLTGLIVAESLVLVLITTPLIMSGRSSTAILLTFIYSIILSIIPPFIRWFLPVMLLRPADSAYFILAYIFYIGSAPMENLDPVARMIANYAFTGALSIAVLVPTLFLINVVLINRKDII